MASFSIKKILTTLALTFTLLQLASAVQHNIEWGLNQNYRAWAAGKTFRVGDTLRFNFTTGAHDVMEVSESDYDSCTNAPSSFINYGVESPIVVKLNANAVRLNAEAGHHYIISGISNDCSRGMKVKFNVVSASAGPTGQPDDGGALSLGYGGWAWVAAAGGVIMAQWIP